MSTQANATSIKELAVNGKSRTSTASTLEELLNELQLAGIPLVVELNGAIIRQNAFAETALASGDRLELVRFVGGG